MRRSDCFLRMVDASRRAACQIWLIEMCGLAVIRVTSATFDGTTLCDGVARNRLSFGVSNDKTDVRD